MVGSKNFQSSIYPLKLIYVNELRSDRLASFSRQSWLKLSLQHKYRINSPGYTAAGCTCGFMLGLMSCDITKTAYMGFKKCRMVKERIGFSSAAVRLFYVLLL